MKNILIKIISIIFFVLILGIGITNLLSLKLSLSILLIIGLIFIFKKLPPKIFIIVAFLLGVIARIYLILELKFNLQSDFLLYYESASDILKGTLNNSYLSYNGYVYVYSSILSILFKIFGESTYTAIIFNFLIQLLTTFVLYKTLCLSKEKITALKWSSIYFILPNVILANFLISTETLFLLFLSLSIYLLLRITDDTKKCYFILLGFVISVANNIRPVMLIFILALIIYFLLQKKFIPLIIVLITYFFTNFLFNIYIENGINYKTVDGALEWSIYYGSNVNTCGAWSEDDSHIVAEVFNNFDNPANKILNKAINRYENNGIDNIKLIGCKFYKLWSDSASNLNFVNLVGKSTTLIKYDDIINNFSKILTILLTLLCLINVFKTKDNLFIQIFTIGYILSNLIVCLNGRYNLPIYLLLILTAYTKE